MVKKVTKRASVKRKSVKKAAPKRKVAKKAAKRKVAKIVKKANVLKKKIGKELTELEGLVLRPMKRILPRGK